jgi:RES domain-containing protein
MPVVWRLAAPVYAHHLDGAGNRVTGARWNSPGRGVVYTCANLSLCVLETYVHLPAELRVTFPDFEAVRIGVPDDAGSTALTSAELQACLATSDPIRACQMIGDRWLEAGSDLIFIAPSIVVPEESNVMINPLHPRMRDVAILSTRLFRFDPRLTGVGVQ